MIDPIPLICSGFSRDIPPDFRPLRGLYRLMDFLSPVPGICALCAKPFRPGSSLLELQAPWQTHLLRQHGLRPLLCPRAGRRAYALLAKPPSRGSAGRSALSAAAQWIAGIVQDESTPVLFAAEAPYLTLQL